MRRTERRRSIYLRRVPLAHGQVPMGIIQRRPNRQREEGTTIVTLSAISASSAYLLPPRWLTANTASSPLPIRTTSPRQHRDRLRDALLLLLTTAHNPPSCPPTRRRACVSSTLIYHGLFGSSSSSPFIYLFVPSSSLHSAFSRLRWERRFGSTASQARACRSPVLAIWSSSMGSQPSVRLSSKGMRPASRRCGTSCTGGQREGCGTHTGASSFSGAV